MSAITAFIAGAAGGAVAAFVYARASSAIAQAKWARRSEDDRWSPADATRAELRLNRRLGRDHPSQIAANPEAYAAWRSGLQRAAVERLLQDVHLCLKGGTRKRPLIWREITVAERRLILLGLRQKVLKFRLWKPRQQKPDQGVMGGRVAAIGRAEVVDIEHPDLSVGLHDGDDAESPGRETASATKRGVAP